MVASFMFSGDEGNVNNVARSKLMIVHCLCISDFCTAIGMFTFTDGLSKLSQCSI